MYDRKIFGFIISFGGGADAYRVRIAGAGSAA